MSTRGNVVSTGKHMAEQSKRVRPSTKEAKPAASVFGSGNPNTKKSQPGK